MNPHENFRLWLTAESHPKFPTILLQTSLKVTYEVSSVTRFLLLKVVQYSLPFSQFKVYVSAGHILDIFLPYIRKVVIYLLTLQKWFY